TKVFPVQQFGDVVTDEPSLLQAADVGLHGEGLVAPPHIDTADAERHSRTDAGLPEWLLGPEWGLSGLKFDAHAVIEGIAIRFARRNQHVLARLGALGVLDGCIHL